MTRTRGDLVGDIALTGFLLLVGLGTVPILGVWGPESRPIDPLGLGLIVVAAVGAGLRRWPLVSLGVATLATSAYLVLSYTYGPILLSVAVAAYTVARHLPLMPAVVAAVVALIPLLAHLFTNDTALDGLLGLLPGSAWIIVPFSVGIARRLVVENAARQRAAAERRVLDDERLRLTSEVHDIVGHGLAAIQMQADIALHLRDRKPDQAERALEAISRTSADALAELRATLAEIAPDDAAREALVPTPGLDRIADLCARMRHAGIDIDLVETGRRRPVPSEIDVAAYRVVQESLTNVARHAAERRARVRIAYTDAAVEIVVTNPTTPTEQASEGFGIAGMRRRVDAVDGTFAADAVDGDFRVAATFPVVVAR